MILKKRIRYLLVVLCLLIFMSEKSFALVIISPKEGDHFQEGDTVKVVAELSPEDKDILDVFIMAYGTVNHCVDLVTHPRYECNIVLNRPSSSDIEFFAGAATPSGVIDAEPVKVFVSLPSNVTLQDLWVDNDQRKEYMSVGNKRKLYVKGLFSDGIKRPLDSLSVGTTFESSKPDIASVNTEGLITAISPGTAEIIVRNKNHRLTTQVKVETVEPRK